MSTKFANLSLAAVLALGVAVSGCNKHPKVAASTTPKPAMTQTPQTEMPRQQTASNDTAPRRTSTTTASSDGSMTKSDRDALNQKLARLEDVLFDYDKATIRPDATKALEGDVTAIRTILERYPTQKVKIEGHADERGSDEYNIALGDKRAVAAKEFLSGMGINGTQLDIVSFGKQRPMCGDHTEDCWQKNRRAHFVAEGSNQ